MATSTHQIDSMVTQCRDQLSKCLRRIHVKPCRMISQTLRHFRNRLNDPRLIIRMHQGNQQSGRSDSLQQLLGIHPTVGVGRHPIHLKAVLCQHLDRFQNRLVLNSCADDVGFSMASSPIRQSQDRQIIAFRCPTRKNHLVDFRIHQMRYLCSRPINRLLRPGPKTMGTTSLVSILLLKEIPNQLTHLWFNRSGRVAV